MQKKNQEITIKDIAAMCGVSISTVSNVLNGRTNKVSKDVADKIATVMEKTGYKPNYLAKNLRATSTKTIGIIVEDLMLFSTSPIIEGVMKRTEEQGYNVVIENVRLFSKLDDKWMHDEALFWSELSPVMSKMEALHVDGIVYIAGYEHDINFKYRPEGVPFAIVYANTNDKDVPCFKLDDEKGGYDSYAYMNSMGHSKIAIIAGEASSPHTINRLRGIQRAMFEKGVLFDPLMVSYQTWNKFGGYNGMKQFEDSDITAVICLSDLIASGVYEYLMEREKKPGRDLSVIGYDNHELSSIVHPTLTTISLPLDKMGYEAATWLINRHGESGESDVVDVRVTGELIERASVIDINK